MRQGALASAPRLKTVLAEALSLPRVLAQEPVPGLSPASEVRWGRLQPLKLVLPQASPRTKLSPRVSRLPKSPLPAHSTQSLDRRAPPPSLPTQRVARNPVRLTSVGVRGASPPVHLAPRSRWLGLPPTQPDLAPPHQPHPDHPNCRRTALHDQASQPYHCCSAAMALPAAATEGKPTQVLEVHPKETCQTVGRPCQLSLAVLAALRTAQVTMLAQHQSRRPAEDLLSLRPPTERQPLDPTAPECLEDHGRALPLTQARAREQAPTPAQPNQVGRRTRADVPAPVLPLRCAGTHR